MVFPYSAQFVLFCFVHHPLAVLKLKPSNLPNRALDTTLNMEKKLSTLSFNILHWLGKWRKFTPAWIPTKLDCLSQGTGETVCYVLHNSTFLSLAEKLALFFFLSRVAMYFYTWQFENKKLMLVQTTLSIELIHNTTK